MKKIIIVADFHVPFQDKRATQLFKNFLKDFCPDKLIIAGDLIDFWEVSHFNKIPKDPDSLQETLDNCHKLLKEFRALLPDTEIIYLEGNHEFRLKRYLMTKAPELYGLKNLSLENLLSLNSCRVQYRKIQELANKFQDNYIQIEDILIGHFDKANKHAAYTAKNLVQEKVSSVIQSHIHRIGMHIKNPVRGNYLKGIENGCMCELSPNYIKDPDWANGFTVLLHNPDKHKVFIYPILIEKDYHFWWGNKEYTL